MARGFDSKAVESQQADAFDGIPRAGAKPDPAGAAKRHRLELARTDLLNRIRRAPEGSYREMLEASLRMLEAELGGTEPT